MSTSSTVTTSSTTTPSSTTMMSSTRITSVVLMVPDEWGLDDENPSLGEDEDDEELETPITDDFELELDDAITVTLDETDELDRDDEDDRLDDELGRDDEEELDRDEDGLAVDDADDDEVEQIDEPFMVPPWSCHHRFPWIEEDCRRSGPAMHALSAG